MPDSWILASDIDNTLTGDSQALRELANRVAAERATGRLLLILSTGRRLDQVLDGIQSEGLPHPDAVISQVGTEIYVPPLALDTAPLEAWDRRLHAQFSRRRAESFLQGISGLQMQPEKFNTPLKVSCYLDQTPDPDAAARLIQKRVRDAGAEDAYQVIWSSGRDLDIIPAGAGKGKAIHFLVDELALDPEHVVVAGDSGNDRTMFEEFERGIVVANAQPELKQLADEKVKADVYFARQSFAAGVHEGLRHFGVLT